jgi:hypothetical protein
MFFHKLLYLCWFHEQTALLTSLLTSLLVVFMRILSEEYLTSLSSLIQVFIDNVKFFITFDVNQSISIKYIHIMWTWIVFYFNKRYNNSCWDQKTSFLSQQSVSWWQKDIEHEKSWSFCSLDVKTTVHQKKKKYQSTYVIDSSLSRLYHWISCIHTFITDDAFKQNDNYQ